MKIHFKLLLGFLTLIILLGFLGGYALRQNGIIGSKMRFLHEGSMQEVAFASRLKVAMYTIYGGVQELLEKSLRERLLRAESEEEEELARERQYAEVTIEKALQDAANCIQNIRAATLRSIEIAKSSADSDLEAAEAHELADWHADIVLHFEDFKAATLRLRRHLQNAELEAATALLENDIERLFRESILPLVDAYHQDAISELDEETEAILQTSRTINTFLLWAVVGFLAAASVVSFTMARQISVPVTRLSKAAADIRKGIDVPRFRHRSRDEFGQLTDVFFDMVANEQAQRQGLEKARGQLADQNERLETAVRERTLDLQAVNRKLSSEIVEHEQTEIRLKNSLSEKETLLKEIHHRVKNNLQIITSLLRLQSQKVDNHAHRESLLDSSARVMSMAMVHEKLYQAEGLAGIDLGDYIDTLSRHLLATYSIRHVKLRPAFETIEVPLDTAIPCGLILNELITNALKHAFEGIANGELFIGLKRVAPGKIRLEIKDNGRGLPSGFDWANANTLGMRLLQTLSQQLGAEVEFVAEKGTRIRLVFAPAMPEADR